MKITIERFEVGGVGAPSASARYYVTFDQPPGNVAAGDPPSYQSSWQTSLANCITWIQGITEQPGP